MKKILIPIAAIFFILTSCKKKNDVVPVGTLSATVGGKKISFDAIAYYSIPLGSTIKQRQFSISSTKLGPSNFILNYNITIFPDNGGPVVKGTYTNAEWGEHFSNATMDYIYPDPSVVAGEYIYVSDSYDIRSTFVTITSITDTNVQGTFTGTLFRINDYAQTVSVINGKFNADIQMHTNWRIPIKPFKSLFKNGWIIDNRIKRASLIGQINTNFER